MPGWGRSNNEVLPLRTCDLFSLSTLNVTTHPFDSLFIQFNLLGFLHELICTYHCFQLSIANNSPQDEAQGLIALLGLRRPRLSIPRGSSMGEVDGGAAHPTGAMRPTSRWCGSDYATIESILWLLLHTSYVALILSFKVTGPSSDADPRQRTIYSKW